MTEQTTQEVGYRRSRRRKTRCWRGYRPVRGKKAYSKGSCKKAGRKVTELKLKF